MRSNETTSRFAFFFSFFFFYTRIESLLARLFALLTVSLTTFEVYGHSSMRRTKNRPEFEIKNLNLHRLLSPLFPLSIHLPSFACPFNLVIGLKSVTEEERGIILGENGDGAMNIGKYKRVKRTYVIYFRVSNFQFHKGNCLGEIFWKIRFEDAFKKSFYKVQLKLRIN